MPPGSGAAPRAGPGVRLLAWRSTRDGWLAAVEVDGPTGELVVPLVGYDVYRIVDERGEELGSRSAGGLLAVPFLRGGRHELRISRRRTGVELAGIGVSLLGLLGFMALRLQIVDGMDKLDIWHFPGAPPRFPPSGWNSPPALWRWLDKSRSTTGVNAVPPRTCQLVGVASPGGRVADPRPGHSSCTEACHGSTA